MVYIPVANRKKKTAGYVPVAQRPKGVDPELLAASKPPERPFIGGESISQGPKKSLFDRLVAKLPAGISRPVQSITNTASESLFGSAQSRTALRYMEEKGQVPDLPTTLKNEGFLSFLGRSNTDRVEHIRSELEKNGTDPARATEIAFYDVFRKQKAANPLDKGADTAEEKFNELAPSKAEQDVLALADLGQKAGIGLDLLNFGGAGTIAKETFPNLVKAVVKSTSPKEISSFLRTVGIAEDIADESAIKLAKFSDKAEVEKEIRAIEELQRTRAAATPQAELPLKTAEELPALTGKKAAAAKAAEDAKYVPTEEESITRSLEQTVEANGRTPIENLPPLPRMPVSKLADEVVTSKTALENARFEREIGSDVLSEMPGAEFKKFESRKHPGELPDMRSFDRSKTVGKNGKRLKDLRTEFEKRGDRIASDLGYPDLDDARKAFDEYVTARTRQKEIQQTVSKRVKDYRDRKAVYDEVIRFVKKEGAARRERVKMVQDFFGMGNKEMKDLLRNERDVRLMNDGEFDDFMKRVSGKATDQFLKQKDLLDLKATIFEKEFVKLDNLRKALKFPTIEKMKPKQLKEFNETLKKFEKGDEFLGVRQLETIQNTELKGIHTIREARGKILDEINAQRARLGKEPITAADLDSVKVSWMDKFRYDPALARQNPVYELMVHETQKSVIKSELAGLEIRDQIDGLMRAARKSRKRGVLDKLIPTDKRIFQWLEAPDAKKMVLAQKMTPEELKAAMYVRDWYAKARDYLVANGTLKKYVSDYVTHVRRGFLESWLEESRSLKTDVSGAPKPGKVQGLGRGLLAALKESVKQYKEDAGFFNIMNEKTGDVLPLEKFFQFSMKRSGELTPTTNVATAFLKYADTFEKKKALDALIPKMDIYIHSLTPKKLTPRGLEFDDSLKRFWKEWMNTKKGRTKDLGFLKPGDPFDFALRTGVALTRIVDLGLNIPVGIASNLGAQIAAYRGLGEKGYAIGQARLNSKAGKAIVEKYKNIAGEPAWKKIRNSESTLGENLQTGVFSLFSFADRKARQVFLLGSLTKEELAAGKVSADRLADIKLAMGRHMPIENMQSVIGKTALGKAFGQYKSWAVPLLDSTLDDINKLQKAVRTKDAKYLKSPEFAELMRTIIISSAVGLGTYGILSDKRPIKSRTFVDKIALKAAQDSLSLIGALDPSFWTSTPRLMQFLNDLGTGIKDTVIASRNTDGDLTGPKKLSRTLTPGAVRQVIPPEKKKSGSGSGIPSLPKLPKVPALPKLPKI